MRLLLLIVVLANYAAQIPYYYHQYYAGRHIPPSLVGSLLLGLTLAWFLAAFYLSGKNRRSGRWLMAGYLAAVFLFYLQTQIVQYLTAHQLFLYVYRPSDPLLFMVFAIGYINFIFAGIYLAYLTKHV